MLGVPPAAARTCADVHALSKMVLTSMLGTACRTLIAKVEKCQSPSAVMLG
jgi:hypothetical protein